MRLASVSLLMTLSGCAASSDVVVQERSLPPAPAWAVPTSVSEPSEGEDAREVIAREREGRLKSNRVVVNFAEWYEGIRRKYGKRP